MSSEQFVVTKAHARRTVAEVVRHHTRASWSEVRRLVRSGQVRVDGQNTVIGGTSAVSPLWAGLTALLNQKLGKPLGFANPLLYAATSSSGFQDITAGNNGAFTAGPGWDPCTGLGRPDGAKLASAIASRPIAASAG